MSEATFYPSGTEAAQDNKTSFKAKHPTRNALLNGAGAVIGIEFAKLGFAVGGETGGAFVMAGTGLTAIEAGRALYHATQTKLAKGLVAAAKAFDNTTGLSKSINSFVSAAKKHAVAATRKEVEMPVEYGSEKGTVTAGVSRDNRSVMSRVFDYMKAKRTK